MSKAVRAVPPTTQAPRVGMISLGCAKNLVDAELMLGSAKAEGFEITNNPAEADILVVNTCGFIDTAKQESIDAILEANRQRDELRPEAADVVDRLRRHHGLHIAMLTGDQHRTAVAVGAAAGIADWCATGLTLGPSSQLNLFVLSKMR